MKKTLWVFTIVLLLTCTAEAQKYNSALGLRVNHGFGGLTYKSFLNTGNAVDFTLSGNSNGIGLTGLYEIHKRASFSHSFYWYYGLGAHVGLWGKGDAATINVGADVVIGAEYMVSEIPFAFSLDYIPSLNIISDFGFNFEGWTLGIKYYLSRPIKKDSDKK